ncbi:methionine ABC transporter ATP-binding protein [Tenuibacillus multivorans]|uniref:D-methionine transport system ATP-binding protein n=1 Tax=Tenuibacillus multivorans TaxID=237069 RepID=A0A1G9WGA5_9BACI|nr:methionine ABC transporter ATP-binding protein [Tenuibacillus multivorans]GEL76452.1 methionine import ATP-binding protein MetN 2 [Tenuibacillus multivorans]SDM83510.1 D-methionine transport system ATP-binding protein [Tenuibacillus multivorans]
MIRFDQVTKTFEHEGGKLTAVDQVNLEIKKGEIFGVIGFSGAGKSTLIRLVNQLERPTSGRVLINDQDLSALSTRELRGIRRNIGMIFQHFNLLETKTVYHNVAFPLLLAGTPKNEVKEKVEEILDFVGLKDRAKHYPDQLSGGQKQRVGIARALATSPSILLCDEATSALDPETTKSILKLLRKVRDEYNITILMITHEMNVIKKICDRVAVMEDGSVIEQDTIFNLFSNPQHPTTQKFVQSVMNDEIPASILSEVESRHIYRVTFNEGTAGKPILSSVAKKFDVDVNVLYGQITELQHIPFGNLVVEFQGNQEEILKAVNDIQQAVRIQEVKVDAS